MQLLISLGNQLQAKVELIHHNGILKRAGIRYRNTYQTRHTYASMMLSQGENIMWVCKQLGHVDVEMVIRTYGRWIPDSSTQSGYRASHDWSRHLG